MTNEYEIEKERYARKNEEKPHSPGWGAIFVLVGSMIGAGIRTTIEMNEYKAKLEQSALNNTINSVQYYDVNKDGLADIVINRGKNELKIYYAFPENGKISYLTIDQIKENKQKQIESKLEQEIKNYKEAK